MVKSRNQRQISPFLKSACPSPLSDNVDVNSQHTAWGHYIPQQDGRADHLFMCHGLECIVGRQYTCALPRLKTRSSPAQVQRVSVRLVYLLTYLLNQKAVLLLKPLKATESNAMIWWRDGIMVCDGMMIWWYYGDVKVLWYDDIMIWYMIKNMMIWW